MKLNELKNKESLVLTMLQKALDKDLPVNISVHLSGDRHAMGKIRSVHYWSDENIVNITYLEMDDNGNMLHAKDWRFRPLTLKMFDELFTLKKHDGILTFVKREDSGE